VNATPANALLERCAYTGRRSYPRLLRLGTHRAAVRGQEAGQIMNMLTARSDTATADTHADARGFLIEIGASVFPVYGDATQGWSIDRHDIIDGTPYRYATLDELIFALVNFSLHVDGSA
jgi:hypothetical protein